MVIWITRCWRCMHFILFLYSTNTPPYFHCICFRKFIFNWYLKMFDNTHSMCLRSVAASIYGVIYFNIWHFLSLYIVLYSFIYGSYPSKCGTLYLYVLSATSLAVRRHLLEPNAQSISSKFITVAWICSTNASSVTRRWGSIVHRAAQIKKWSQIWFNSLS